MELVCVPEDAPGRHAARVEVNGAEHPRGGGLVQNDLVEVDVAVRRRLVAGVSAGEREQIGYEALHPHRLSQHVARHHLPIRSRGDTAPAHGLGRRPRRRSAGWGPHRFGGRPPDGR